VAAGIGYGPLTAGVGSRFSLPKLPAGEDT
jgi:hypothetical protein